jgi:hypothetical protein
MAWFLVKHRDNFTFTSSPQSLKCLWFWINFVQSDGTVWDVLLCIVLHYACQKGDELPNIGLGEVCMLLYFLYQPSAAWYIDDPNFWVISYCNIAIHIGGCIQKFLDWPPGARTANGTALCHEVQLYCYSVSQSSEFCHHNLLCCFSTSVYCCCL